MNCKIILELIGDNTPVNPSTEGLCACCGDDMTHAGGVEFKSIFSSSTFNLNHWFYNPTLQYVCSYCAVFFNRTNWLEYCARNGKDGYFPLKKGAIKGSKRAPANWVFFSHAFYKGRHEIVTDRKRWRDLIMNPPKPPFCFVISTICKKHLIFKSPICYSADEIQLRFEDVIITFNRKEFICILNDFECLYDFGLSKSSIKTGDYNTSTLLKVDEKDRFYLLDGKIEEVRRNNPDLLDLCEFIGSKTDG